MNRACIWLLAVAWLLSQGVAMGSGSYRVILPKPRPGAAEDNLDAARYALGQQVFNGRIRLNPTKESADQTARLQRIQEALPESSARNRDLPALAGKLTESQLSALEYFFSRRYPDASKP